MQKVNGQMPFNSTLDCAKKIVVSSNRISLSIILKIIVSFLKDKNGIKGLYAGLGPPLTFISVIFSLRFFGFQLGKRLQQTKDNQQLLDSSQLFKAGFMSGLVSSFVTAPG